MAVLGVGSLAGALNLAFFSDHPRFKVMFALAMTLGLAELAVAVASSIPTSLWVALPLLAIVGFAMSTTAATANTIVQTSSPDAMRGRIMALYMTVFNGVAPVGSLMTGALADRFGAPVAVAICGTTAAILAGAIWLYSRTRDLRPRVVTVANGGAEPMPTTVAPASSRQGRATAADAVRVPTLARRRDVPAYAQDEPAED
jgi:predicted MFS family arabinose efflux permease